MARQYHGVPAFFSFFLPGVGQLIKGHVAKAFAVWFLLTFTGVLGTFLFVGLPPVGLLVYAVGFATWAFQVYDAYRPDPDDEG